MSRFKFLFQNSLIFAISNFASKILGFLMIPLYTRVLSKEDFGSVDLIIFSIGLMMPILTLSISESIIRFTIDDKEDKNQVFSFGIKIHLCAYLVLLCFLPIVLKIPLIKDYVFWFYAIFFIQSINLYFNMFTRGLKKIKLIGITGVVQTIVTVSSNIILLVVFDFGIEGFFISILLANTVALLVIYFGANLVDFMTIRKTNKRLIKEILKYSVPLMPTRTSWWFNNYSNKYIVANFYGIAELGLFAAASRVPSILITFQGIFIQAWEISALSEYNKKDGIVFFSKIYNLYNFVLLSGCSLLITFVKPISGFMFGPEFRDAWRLVPFLLVAVIFGGLIGFFNTINMAKKKTNALILPVLVGASIGVVINLFFVPEFGAIAASVSVVISYFVIWLMRLINANKYMKLKINYLRDVFSYLIVLFQAIYTVFFDFDIISISMLVCFIFILLIHIKTIIYIYKYLYDKYLHKV